MSPAPPSSAQRPANAVWRTVELRRTLTDMVDDPHASMTTGDGPQGAAAAVSTVPALLAMESIRDAFYIVDAQWRIVFFNAYAERHFGRRRADVLGRSLYDVFPNASHSAFDPPFRAAMGSRSAARVEAESVGRDGRYVEVEAVPCGDGLALQVRDITERKHIERRLREREASLADADRQKDEFLAVLSHELRNPLAPLTNVLRLLDRSAALGPAERSLLAIAERQRVQLTRLVDDLLEVSRISRGKVELRLAPMSVHEALHDAVEAADTVARSRGLTLRCVLPETPCEIVADAARVAQMLGNLIDNAIKHTPRGGEIRLRADDLGERIALAVEDTGRGIDPTQLDRLFEPFVQLERHGRPPEGGLGIGLALVRRLAEMHGGQAIGHSEGPGRGARFVVTLPRVGPGDPIG